MAHDLDYIRMMELGYERGNIAREGVPVPAIFVTLNHFYRPRQCLICREARSIIDSIRLPGAGEFEIPEVGEVAEETPTILKVFYQLNGPRKNPAVGENFPVPAILKALNQLNRPWERLIVGYSSLQTASLHKALSQFNGPGQGRVVRKNNPIPSLLEALEQLLGPRQCAVSRKAARIIARPNKLVDKCFGPRQGRIEGSKTHKNQ